MARKLTEAEKERRELLSQISKLKKEKASEKAKLQKEIDSTKKKLAKEIEKNKKKKPYAPPMIKVGGKSKGSQSASSRGKRAVVVHKKSEKITGLQSVLSKTEETILELTRLLSEVKGSKHRGIRGRFKLTPKEQVIKEQIEKAHKRAEKIMNIMIKG